MKKFLLGAFRIFLLITGFIPFLFILKPKYLFVSEKAKNDYKKNKKGVLLICNHTAILDYYCFMFKYAPSYVHALVGEVVYYNKFMCLLNDAVGNIKVDRNQANNLMPIQKCIDLLKRGKKVIIFPEGKLEDKKGRLEKFTSSFALISAMSGKPIIPFYTDGNYGMFKRPRIIVGEMMTPPTDCEEKTLKEYTDNARSYINELGTICRDHKKAKTKTLFTKMFTILDLVRLTSIPFFYLIFPTKKYYFGDRKKIRKALKYNAMLCSNHTGPCDVLFIYMHFLSRRARFIAAEEVYFAKFLAWCMDHAGVIRYQRKTMQESMDLKAFKECLETLNGRGVLAIFPEGHINFDVSFDSSFKEGAATFSLMTNSPIIPFIFVEPYRYWCFNHVVIGDPIYPSDYGFNKDDVGIDNINKYNEIIYAKMKELYDYSLTKRRKHYGQRRYFRSLEEDSQKDQQKS
ncbi:MAG: 1-acyl-sn-glycerol-3-phosphate acyltransferase [Bacilli bacterium]|nr:1-acyl-sn-glycerol-3-phosphate acyltransferase [Bacilli bacterium]MBO4682802.1 1-acyl-sn-glycerol-3-phosphate acyltransferase [Bacilli bacterium]